MSKGRGESDTRIVLARANIEADAKLSRIRKAFSLRVAALAGDAAKQGALGGSAYAEHMHNVCASELRARAAVLYESSINSLIGVSAAPSDELRSALKDWIANQIANETKTMEGFLRRPRPQFGESGAADSLTDDARREQDAIFVRIDNAFDRLRRDYWERIVRFLARIAARAWSVITFSR